MNLVRSIVNDAQAGTTGTPGEGQIITDNTQISPFTQPFLNSAIREVYRELRCVGQPTLIKDNVIIPNCPVVNSPTYGLGMPDTAVQTYLGFNGFFDGLEIWPTPTLPGDVIVVERVWERQTGAGNNPFVPLTQSEFGIPSVLQGPKNKVWEWRNDSIWMPGTLTPVDMRLRYWCALPTFFGENVDFDSTYVPIIDCTDAVAYKTAFKYATMLGSPGAAGVGEESKRQMFYLKNQHVRRSQSVNYSRPPYHGGDHGVSNSGFIVGWQ
jgi:hypothetical protein